MCFTWVNSVVDSTLHASFMTVGCDLVFFFNEVCGLSFMQDWLQLIN